MMKRHLAIVINLVVPQEKAEAFEKALDHHGAYTREAIEALSALLQSSRDTPYPPGCWISPAAKLDDKRYVPLQPGEKW